MADAELVAKIFAKAAQHSKKGEIKEAQNLYLRILQEHAGHAASLCNLGYLCYLEKRYDEAVRYAHEALANHPRHASAYNVLGIVYSAKGERQRSLENFKLSVFHGGDNKDALKNLATVAMKEKDYTSAVEAYRKFLSLSLHAGQIVSMLVYAQRMLMDWQGLSQQEEKLRQLIYDKNGEVSVFPLLLCSLEPHELRQAAVNRNRLLGQTLGQFAAPKKTRASASKIKIGYFSANIKGHPLALQTAHLYQNHDRDKFEIYAYASAPTDDTAVAKMIKHKADCFRDLSDLSDASAYNVIQQDDIDIIVDLDGNRESNRQTLLLRRPAPSVVNYLGFAGSMGTHYHDYIIADKYLLPPSARHGYSEASLYVSCAYAYQRFFLKPQGLGERAKHGLPSQGVILSAFHSPAKISPHIFNIWMQIMRACPQAYLWLVKDSQVQQDNCIRHAASYSIDRERLIFADMVAVQEHQARYQHVDLALDTFPCNGCANTMDALFDGCAVLTLSGKNMAGRIGGSLLSVVGLGNFVTQNSEDYIKRACALIDKVDNLRMSREKIRRAVQASPLFDGLRMTRELEQCYQHIVSNPRT